MERSLREEGTNTSFPYPSKSGVALGTAGSGVDLNVAAAGNTEVVRAKLKVMQSLGLKDGIEDILITLGSQYHLIRMIQAKPNLFLYLVLNRDKANLAMARHALSELEGSIQIWARSRAAGPRRLR